MKAPTQGADLGTGSQWAAAQDNTREARRHGTLYKGLVSSTVLLNSTRLLENLTKHISELPTYRQKGKHLSFLSLLPRSKVAHWLISSTFLGWETVSAKQVPKGIPCCGFQEASGLKAKGTGFWPQCRAVSLWPGKACQNWHRAVTKEWQGGESRLTGYYSGRQEMPHTGSYH